MMPSKLCPYCGFRISRKATTCPICGAELQVPPLATASQAPDAHIAVSAALPLPIVPDPVTLSPIPAQPSDDTAPLEIIQEPVPGQQRFAPLVQATPKRSKVRLPARPAELEGTIIGLYTQFESPVKHQFNLLTDSIDLALDLLLPVMSSAQGVERDYKKRVMIVRLHASDGGQCDARFEGDLVGSGLTMGDRLVLWGRDRQGTLLVERGYNYTSQAAILLNAAQPSVLASLFPPVLMLLLLFSAYLWLHFFVAFPSH